MEGSNGIVDLSNKNISSLNEVFVKNKEQVYHLTLSYNLLKRLNGVELYLNLKTLIIDNNQCYSLQNFPVFNKLDTFSAISNQFDNLDEFIELSKSKFPKLTNLSLQKNPMVPNLSNVKEYFTYRATILNARSDILILDSMPLEPVDMTMFDYMDHDQQQTAPKKIEKARVVLPDSNGIIETDPRYAVPQKKKFSTRSEGNRFVKNKDL